MTEDGHTKPSAGDNPAEPRYGTGPQVLRDALDVGRFVVAPGCYDSLGARLAELHGFPAVYMSGLAVTASQLADPDIELLSMNEMVRQAGLMASAVSIPIIADADTGYGGLANVELLPRSV